MLSLLGAGCRNSVEERCSGRSLHHKTSKVSVLANAVTGFTLRRLQTGPTRQTSCVYFLSRNLATHSWCIQYKLFTCVHFRLLKDLQQSGARRLRDAIIFGFQLQAHPGRVDDIPDWYVPSRTRLDLLPEVKTNDIEVPKQQNGPLTREM